MEVEALLNKKIKLRKKINFVRDCLMILLAVLFILVAFLYILDKENVIGDTYKNLRYGLFAFALIISATGIIIAVYLKPREPIKMPKKIVKRTDSKKDKFSIDN